MANATTERIIGTIGSEECSLFAQKVNYFSEKNLEESAKTNRLSDFIVRDAFTAKILIWTVKKHRFSIFANFYFRLVLVCFRQPKTINI